jgi:hypothetical protein
VHGCSYFRGRKLAGNNPEWHQVERQLIPTFSDFRSAIQEVQDGVSTKYAERLATLMTLKFQQFEDVSLVAA